LNGSAAVGTRIHFAGVKLVLAPSTVRDQEPRGNALRYAGRAADYQLGRANNHGNASGVELAAIDYVA
jgi:hypothetical protein